MYKFIHFYPLYPHKAIYKKEMNKMDISQDDKVL